MSLLPPPPPPPPPPSPNLSDSDVPNYDFSFLDMLMLREEVLAIAMTLRDFGYNDHDDDYEEGILDILFDDGEEAMSATRESIEKLELVKAEGSSFCCGCAVCLEEFSMGCEAKRLPCMHVYHAQCIDTWLMNSTTCPLCRYQLG